MSMHLYSIVRQMACMIFYFYFISLIVDLYNLGNTLLNMVILLGSVYPGDSKFIKFLNSVSSTKLKGLMLNN